MIRTIVELVVGANSLIALGAFAFRIQRRKRGRTIQDILEENEALDQMIERERKGGRWKKTNTTSKDGN